MSLGTLAAKFLTYKHGYGQLISKTTTTTNDRDVEAAENCGRINISDASVMGFP